VFALIVLVTRLDVNDARCWAGALLLAHLVASAAGRRASSSVKSFGVVTATFGNVKREEEGEIVMDELIGAADEVGRVACWERA
jgi:hypothetical protein